jgi:putative two-component system response regulator
LVLLDLMLPKKDGFGVLEDIQKIPALAHIPIIVLSNLGQESDKERALSLGAKEYVVKVDYAIQEVIDKVKGYFG